MGAAGTAGRRLRFFIIFIFHQRISAVDFVTHSLVGAGVARLACPKREWLPQLTLAGLLGSLLMDGDSWLIFFGPDAYGFYHRVLTHNVFALGVLSLASSGVAWGAGRVRRWRRFGWFAAPNLGGESEPGAAPWRLLIGVAIVAAIFHWLYDYITGYGNLKPLWPLSQKEYALAAVASWDTVIFSVTLGWHLLIRHLDWPRRKEAWLTAGYLAIIAAYVAGCHAWGKPTVW